MFTITIIIGNQSTAINIYSNTTAHQILDYLKENGHIPQFQSNFHLHFNGGLLPLNEPVGQFGVGPNTIVKIVSISKPGFSGAGKETLLKTLLKAFTNLK